MESYSRLYTKKIVDSIIHGLEQRHNSILFVKHYNTLNVPVENIQEAVANSKKSIELYYHEFSSSKMQEAYEPFLGWIKQIYFKYYYDVPVTEFLDEAGVYFLARSAFESYILTGKCKRTEDMIVVETEYELTRFADSLTNLFSYVSREHTLFFVLNRLHLAENSTLFFLTEFVTKLSGNISLLANYNEAYVVPAYTQARWASLVHKIEDMNYMLEWNVQDVQTNINIIDVFEPVVTDFPEYLVMINNMVQTVAIKQAMYYLKILYNKISTEKVNVSAKNRAKFFVLYALASLYDKNITNALIMCEKLRSINEKHPNLKYTFNYYYLLALCESFKGQRSLAQKNCEKCTQIATELESDRYLFMSKLLYYIYSLDNWNNTYRWDMKFEGKESAYTDNARRVLDVIANLRKLGFQVEMDDFGSGYSSLNMLSDMPVDVLKMDMKFIRNIETSETDRRLVSLILDIGQYLKVSVVAEGVETEGQMNILQKGGCDLVQGYYFSRPLPPEKFEKLIERELAVERK